MMPLTEFAAESGAPMSEEGAAPLGSALLVLDLSAIVPSATNPRKHFNQARLEELAQTIKTGGVLQPVLARPLPASRLQDTFEGRRKGDPLPAYELIAGERRWRASKIAGETTIPAIVRHLTDQQSRQIQEMQLVENLQRDDLHPMEEAEGYEDICRETGVSKEELGERIGRSRGYVYARIKLLALCQQARDAFYEGTIDASRALVIARIPDTKLQLKALEEATAKDWDDGPRHNFKSFVRWAQQNVMLRLDAARFKITDESLVPEAGNCKVCPKRTGAEPDVYADVDSADVCTDPACFHAKEQAHEAIVIAEARVKGQQIITEKEAKKVWQWEHLKIDGYTRLDRPDPRVGGSKMLKTVLGKDMPTPVLMQNPHKKGELIEVLPSSQVTKLLKAAGKIEPKAKADAFARVTQEALPVEQRREYHNRWQAEALRRAEAHFKDWKEGIPAAVLRAFLIYTLTIADEGPFGPALGLGDEFNTADALHRLEDMPDSSVNEVFIRWVLHDTECGHPSPWTDQQLNSVAPRHPALEILHIAGVDVAEVKSETKRSMESDDRAAEMAKAEASTLAKEEDAEKATASPAAPAPRARKSTKAQAQREISGALQALDDGASEAENQAPDGAGLDEGAAPAAPAGSTALPQVGDRVAVDQISHHDHLREGTVLQVRGSGKARVQFDGDEGEALLPIGWLKVLATSLWPFPRLPGTPAAATPAPAPDLKIGQLARVKAGSKGPGGKPLKTIGRVGRVVGLGDDGRVHLKHGERKHELVVVEAEHVEPYVTLPTIGDKVRVLRVGALAADQAKYLWQQGTVEELHSDHGYGVRFGRGAGLGPEFGYFDGDALEVLA